MSKSLAEIKYRLNMIENVHPAFGHQKEELLNDLYSDGDISLLLQKTEHFEVLAEIHDDVLGENKRLRESLEFYASEKSYEVDVVSQWEPVVPVIEDAGERARKTLEVSTK